MKIQQLLAEKDLVICVGSGGVDGAHATCPVSQAACMNCTTKRVLKRLMLTSDQILFFLGTR